jgi:hypothetical protein
MLLPQHVVRLESLTVHRLGLAGQVPLHRDAAALLRRTSALLGSGRELVVAVRRTD